MKQKYCFFLNVLVGISLASNVYSQCPTQTGCGNLYVSNNGTKVVTTSSSELALDVQKPGYLITRFKNNGGSGDKSSLVQFESGDAAPHLWLTGVGGVGNGFNLTDGQFYLERVGTGVFMTVTKNGNIGMGTMNPTHKLAVNGTIQAKEIIGKTGWSDFVFEKDYKLRSLSQVDAFVKENKHLPEIPSAKEVEENGVGVGKVESLLLMKVEELTLYLIEQDKRLAEQNKRLKELEVQNIELQYAVRHLKK